MEMISTSKMKKMQVRLSKSKPYEKKLEHILLTLFDSGFSAPDDTFLKIQKGKELSTKLILMITGNRGLCGGYNTNVIENTLSFRDQLMTEGNTQVMLRIIGKKGINYLKFINLPVYKSEINLEDKITFNDAKKLAYELMEVYKTEELNEIYLSYTKVLSSASYKPAIHRLLPVSIEEMQKEIPIEERHGLRAKYIFEPGADKMLTSLLPLYITNKLYMCLLESGYAEQNARRAAMKNATDAATEMVRDLTIKYNRARQAKITNEIAEIVGGASALE